MYQILNQIQLQQILDAISPYMSGGLKISSRTPEQIVDVQPTIINVEKRKIGNDINSTQVFLLQHNTENWQTGGSISTTKKK